MEWESVVESVNAPEWVLFLYIMHFLLACTPGVLPGIWFSHFCAQCTIFEILTEGGETISQEKGENIHLHALAHTNHVC